MNLYGHTIDVNRATVFVIKLYGYNYLKYGNFNTEKRYNT